LSALRLADSFLKSGAATCCPIRECCLVAPVPLWDCGSARERQDDRPTGHRAASPTNTMPRRSGVRWRRAQTVRPPEPHLSRVSSAALYCPLIRMRGAFAAVRGCVAVVSIAPSCVVAGGAIGPSPPEGGETEAPTSDDMMPRSGVMHRRGVGGSRQNNQEA
jgi:hypothetical protein